MKFEFELDEKEQQIFVAVQKIFGRHDTQLFFVEPLCINFSWMGEYREDGPYSSLSFTPDALSPELCYHKGNKLMTVEVIEQLTKLGVKLIAYSHLDLGTYHPVDWTDCDDYKIKNNEGE